MGPVFKLYLELVKMLHEEMPNACIIPYDLVHSYDYARIVAALPDDTTYAFIIRARSYLVESFFLEIYNDRELLAEYPPTDLDSIQSHIKRLAKLELPIEDMISFYPHMSALLDFLSSVISPVSMELCDFGGSTYAQYFSRTCEPTIDTLDDLSSFAHIGFVLLFQLKLKCPHTHNDIIVPGFFGMCMGIDVCEEPLDGVFYGFDTKEYGIRRDDGLCTTTFDEDGFYDFMKQFLADYESVRLQPAKYGYLDDSFYTALGL